MFEIKKNQLINLLLVSILPQISFAVCQTGSIVASTPSSRFVDNNDETVTDTKTGLMWKKCAEGISGSSCNTGVLTSYTWQNALTQAQNVNAAGFAGKTDWRLPNVKELASIVEDQCHSPAINSVVFPGTLTSATNSNGAFWSSSPYLGNAGQSLKVNFTRGGIDAVNRSSLAFVRLVRSN